MKNFQLGSVPYLNARPLHEGIPSESLTTLPPQQLVQEFEKGNLDAALLPTYYILQQKNPTLVPDLGIACEGTVLSVLIQPTSPEQSLSNLQSLKPSHESVTSNRLAEVLLKKYHRQNFQWNPQNFDGEVIIGDSALKLKAQHPTAPLIDLGDAWWNATQLPFVFALWMIHPKKSEKEIREITDLIQNSWRLGKSKLNSYAKTALEFQYLSHYLRYELDERFHQGIERWNQDLKELKLNSN